MNEKMLKVTQTKSKNGRLAKHKATLLSLGIRRLHHTIFVRDTPENRGMISKISYMLNVEVV